MSDQIQLAAVYVASAALECYTLENFVAAQIKQKSDKHQGFTGTSSSAGKVDPTLLMVRPICFTPHSLPRIPAWTRLRLCERGYVDPFPLHPPIHPSLALDSYTDLCYHRRNNVCTSTLKPSPSSADPEVMSRPSALSSTHWAAGGSERRWMSD